MDRRGLLRALLAAPLAGASWLVQAQKKGKMMVDELQQNWKNYLAAGVATPAPSEPVKLSKEEWRKRLPPASYNVLREDGTERAGSSPLDREKRAGVFTCAGCELPLFTSAMKFDSGTGWPSFFTTISGVFTEKTDYYLIYPRTEYRCKRCDGHHGHLFKDGPQPTGLRYCNNGVALKFIPKDAKA
jgi:peptide-methionine (R)-S-oxide reductase